MLKREIVAELKEMGVPAEYRSGLKRALEAVLERCIAIKKIYAKWLEWEDVGPELNVWLRRKDSTLEYIEERVKLHSELRPEDIGMK